MSEFLRDDFLKDDSGDDVEAHSVLGPKDGLAQPLDGMMASDEGDDVEAHSMLGPKDALLDKQKKVL